MEQEFCMTRLYWGLNYTQWVWNIRRTGKNIVLNENSVDRKPCINKEIKSDELTIKLYSCHDINMDFLVFVTPPSIYHQGWAIWLVHWFVSLEQPVWEV